MRRSIPSLKGHHYRKKASNAMDNPPSCEHGYDLISDCPFCSADVFCGCVLPPPGPWAGYPIKKQFCKRGGKGCTFNAQHFEWGDEGRLQEDRLLVRLIKIALSNAPQVLQRLSDGCWPERKGQQKGSLLHWSDEEAAVFLIGLFNWGWGFWQNIASLIPGRTNKHVSHHAYKLAERFPKLEKIKRARCPHGNANRMRKDALHYPFNVCSICNNERLAGVNRERLRASNAMDNPPSCEHGYDLISDCPFCSADVFCGCVLPPPGPWAGYPIKKQFCKRGGKGCTFNAQHFEWGDEGRLQEDRLLVRLITIALSNAPQVLQRLRDGWWAEGRGIKKKGEWSKEEAAIFLLGLDIHGWGAWTSISTLLPGRNNIHVGAHAGKLAKKFPDLKELSRSTCPHGFFWRGVGQCFVCSPWNFCGCLHDGYPVHKMKCKRQQEKCVFDRKAVTKIPKVRGRSSSGISGLSLHSRLHR